MYLQSMACYVARSTLAKPALCTFPLFLYARRVLSLLDKGDFEGLFPLPKAVGGIGRDSNVVRKSLQTHSKRFLQQRINAIF